MLNLGVIYNVYQLIYFLPLCFLLLFLIPFSSLQQPIPFKMLQDKYIGLTLAMSSSVFIGISFIITKKGLINANKRHGTSAADGDHHYLKNWTWWVGMITMAVGEVLNFSAYSFAPPILVTPLGALSVILGAIFASIFLKEKLGTMGKIGCLLSVVGALIIVLHAPEDKEVTSIDELLFYALRPGFMSYCVIVIGVSVFLIYKVVPTYGKRNPFIYVSICSLVGSVSVMSIKAFGIALKLTISGNNQFTHASTYMFGLVVIICILTQMNYFNKALAQFSTNVVNPIYFVCFTTATIAASAILFQGLNTDNPVNLVSLICGFIIIFAGVYLLDSIARTEDDRVKTEEDEGLLNDSFLLEEEEESLGLTELLDDDPL
ncbi:magnesium transporter NIPA-domain-containing protein [Pilaira anomala]|nr:magnesium transporter NIPA-domain-containing protein [Pilaira anomala]